MSEGNMTILAGHDQVIGVMVIGVAIDMMDLKMSVKPCYAAE